jgi:hypothetical protein
MADTVTAAALARYFGLAPRAIDDFVKGQEDRAEVHYQGQRL